MLKTKPYDPREFLRKEEIPEYPGHGLGGIQDRHYDRHDYPPEKRRALEAWAARLRGETVGAVVVPFHSQ